MFQKKFILPLFLLIQIGFMKIISFYPELVEKFYSNGFYIYLSKIIRTVLGMFPFSIGDIFYIIVITYILKSIWHYRKNWKENWKIITLKTLSFLSVAYFLFHILWALNYYRVPLFEKMNIKKEYSQADLILFTEKIIAKTNAIQEQITKNKNIKVVNTISHEQLFEMAQNGYDILGKKYSFFKYETPSIKESLFSLPLTYMGFAGYLNPFTNEAQVNYKMPRYSSPMTICHEMAHQMGYASESECNFIGYLSAENNENLYFKYSAYTTALKYCLNIIQGYTEDKNKIEPYLKKINPGVLQNFKDDEIFWTKYESFIETGFKIFYNNYLKLNQQEDGLESYSKFLDLLINYEKKY